MSVAGFDAMVGGRFLFMGALASSEAASRNPTVFVIVLV
jgi:hypothetical protein